MPLYESVFIARQDISSAQAEALGETFAGVVTNMGGTVSKKEYWGLRNLAYRIKKNRKGHYMLLNVDAPPGTVAELERNMRINEDVLRYLTIKVEELEEGPSAILRSREERGPRGGRGRRDDDRGPRRDDDRGPRRDDDRGPRRDDDRPRRDDDRPRRDDDRPRRPRADAPVRDEAESAEEGDRS